MNSFLNDEKRVAFILDEEQPDDLKMPVVSEISDDSLLIRIIASLKPFRRYADEADHRELVLAVAGAVQDGELLEEAAKGFREETRQLIYPILMEKCPGYTPKFVVRDVHARSECRWAAFDTIREQAARDGRCLYITSEKTGEEWIYSNRADAVTLVFADTDPYFSIADYLAYGTESGVLADEENGRLALWECLPGAFTKLYQGWQCSLYSVPEVLFLKEPTNWETMKVCTDMVPVVHEERIEDAWHALVSAAQDGLCVIHEYTEGEEYNNALDRVSERIRLRSEKPLFIIENGTLVSYVANHDKHVEELIIPDGVTSIGYRAFYEAWWVGSFKIPGSVRVIEEEAFYGCTMSRVEIPEGVTTIEKWAFGNCECLNEVTIPDSVKSIGPWAFGYRRNVQFYDDPEPVDRHQYHQLITLIGKKGGEAQRYAGDNEWYDCCQIAAFKKKEDNFVQI